MAMAVEESMIGHGSQPPAAKGAGTFFVVATSTVEGTAGPSAATPATAAVKVVKTRARARASGERLVVLALRQGLVRDDRFSHHGSSKGNGW